MLLVQNSGASLQTALDTQEFIVWGGNDKGQLGLGTYEDEFCPRKLDFFHKR